MNSEFRKLVHGRAVLGVGAILKTNSLACAPNFSANQPKTQHPSPNTNIRTPELIRTNPNKPEHSSTTNHQRPKSKLRSGFSLIEAVAAIALVGIGVTSAMTGLAAMAKTDRLIIEREQLQRLAVRKYDEIVATGQIDTADLSGDLSEQNLDGYEWSAIIEPSGEENLEILSVTVNAAGDAEGPQATIDGLIFRAPVEGGAQ